MPLAPVAGSAWKICGDQVLLLENGKVQVGQGEFMGCIACGQCVAVCPTGGITVAGRGMTPEDAFTLPPAFHRATADQLEALLLARRSIRRFKDQEIGLDAMDRILKMTSAAPMGFPRATWASSCFTAARKSSSLPPTPVPPSKAWRGFSIP